VWSFIQISLQITFSGVTNSDRSWIDFTYIFYQPRILDQFWYLPALFNATIFYLLLKNKAKVSTLYQLCLGIFFYFISPLFQGISMLSDWMEFYFFFALGDAASTLFFKNKVQNFFKSKWTLLAVLPVFILSQYYYLSHLGHPEVLVKYEHGSRYDYLRNVSDQAIFLGIALIGCLSMFVLAFRLQQLNTLKALRVLGYHSLYIYVMHVIITAFVRLSLIIIFGITNPFVLLCTSIIFGVTVPVIAYNTLINKGPLWFLFSWKKPKSPVPVVEQVSVIKIPDVVPKVAPQLSTLNSTSLQQ
jgi:hypothetical protein